jgi:hypothetical protein
MAEVKADLEAYRFVMACAKQRAPDGSPQSWLAGKLKITRQAVHRWRIDGVSPRQVRSISKLLGISPALIRPSLVAGYLPQDLFEKIAALAYEKRRDFAEELADAVRAGLNSYKQLEMQYGSEEKRRA